MALITKNENRKSTGSYLRLTGNTKIAQLMTAVHAAAICTGNQVGLKLTISYEGNLPIFFGKDVNTAKKTLNKIKENPDGVIIFGGYISYFNEIGKQKKQEVDVIIFVNGKVYCYEIKDGNSLDTKKSKSDLIEEEKEPEKELEDVNILIGRFQPFHNGHLKMAKAMKKENDLPCIVAVVHPGHNSSGKSPFDEDLVKKYMEAVVRENPDLLCGFFIVNRGLLGVIYGTAKSHGFNVKSIGAGEDRILDYRKQIDYLKKNGSDFPKDIEIVKTPRATSATEVREKIKNEDFTSFRKLVPPSISSLYNSLVTGMNSHVKANESLESE